MKLSCRTCGLGIPPENVNLVSGTCFCPQCDQTFPITTASVAVEIPGGAAPRPADTRIEFVADDETLGIIIPPGVNRLLRSVLVASAVVFNAFTAIVVVSALLPRVNVSAMGATFLVVIGMGIAGLALYAARGEFTLALNRRECTAVWTLFRWHFTRRVPRGAITDIIEQEIFRSNGRPRHAILIKHGTGGILFGATLTNEERHWLADELRRFLRLPGAMPPVTATNA